MKCPNCDGTGLDLNKIPDAVVNCGACNGTGEIEQTNEEWFCGLSTEEKAKFFDRVCYSAWGDINIRFCDMTDYTDWEAWLKEVHNDNT